MKIEVFVVSYFNELVSTFGKWWATYVQVRQGHFLSTDNEGK